MDMDSKKFVPATTQLTESSIFETPYKDEAEHPVFGQPESNQYFDPLPEPLSIDVSVACVSSKEKELNSDVLTSTAIDDFSTTISSTTFAFNTTFSAGESHSTEGVSQDDLADFGTSQQYHDNFFVTKYSSFGCFATSQVKPLFSNCIDSHDDFGDFNAVSATCTLNANITSHDHFDSFSNTTLDDKLKISPNDDDFGDFSSIVSNKANVTSSDEFSDFNTTVSTSYKSKDSTPSISHDDFGEFSTATCTSAALPINTNSCDNLEFCSQPVTDNIEKKLGEISSLISTDRSTRSDVLISATSEENDKASETCVYQKNNEVIEIVYCCFPNVSTLNNTKSMISNNILSHEQELSLWSELGGKSLSSRFFFQWNNSLLQNHFYLAINIDPMLMSSNKSLSLFGDIGSSLIVEPGKSVGQVISQKADEGNTLLDLTLPTSPTFDNKEPESAFLDLLGLTFSEEITNAAGSNYTNKVTSWVDSELQDIIATDISNYSSKTSAFTDLGNQSNSQSVLPTQEMKKIPNTDVDNSYCLPMLKNLPELGFMSANNLIF